MRPLSTAELCALVPPVKTISPELSRELEARGLIELYRDSDRPMFRLTALGELALRVHAAFLSSVYSEGVRIT
jgi:hypothetical protein